MLQFDLKFIFKARGVKRGYTFLKQIGITHSLAHRLSAGNVNSMSFVHIEKVCEALHCTPNDLLNWTPSDQQQVAPDHPLQSLRRSESERMDILKEIEKLPLDKMGELKEQIKKINEK